MYIRTISTRILNVKDTCIPVSRYPYSPSPVPQSTTSIINNNMNMNARPSLFTQQKPMILTRSTWRLTSSNDPPNHPTNVQHTNIKHMHIMCNLRITKTILSLSHRLAQHNVYKLQNVLPYPHLTPRRIWLYLILPTIPLPLPRILQNARTRRSNSVLTLIPTNPLSTPRLTMV